MTADQMQDEKYIKMTQTPVEKLVCQLAVPTIISMLISALYNMADTFFVGQLGTSATGGVGISFALMTIIQAIGFFFGHGSGNYISRQLGAQNFDEASKMAATGFFSAFITGLFIAVTGIVFLNPLARGLGATDTILPYAKDYLFFILLGTPFMASSLMLNNLLRFQGSAVYGMVGMTTGAVLNVVLDPLLIFQFHMGVKGAALATMISQTVSCIILLIGCSRKGNISIHPKNFSPTVQNYKQIIKGGTPSLLRQGLASVASIALNQVAGGYGDAAIAAMSVVSRVTMFANSALLGFGQGFQPVCGFNYGAGKYDRVTKAFWFCVKVAFVALLIIAGVMFFFAPQVISLFRADDLQVIEIGSFALRLQCLVYPLMSWMILSNMLLQTIGKSAKASLLATARQGLFFLPLLFVLVPNLGVLGIQLTQPLADFGSFLVAVPLTASVLKEMKLQTKLQQTADTPTQ